MRASGTAAAYDSAGTRNDIVAMAAQHHGGKLVSLYPPAVHPMYAIESSRMGRRLAAARGELPHPNVAQVTLLLVEIQRSAPVPRPGESMLVAASKPVRRRLIRQGPARIVPGEAACALVHVRVELRAWATTTSQRVGSCVRGHVRVPADGQRKSPLVAK